MSEYELSKVGVVFMDIGGVLLTNGWDHHARQRAARAFDIDYDAFDERHRFIYNVLEMGRISLDQYLDTAVFYTPRSFSVEDFKAFMYAQSVELPHMLSWLRRWKSKCEIPVYALSNESRELNAFRIEKFGLREVFDGFFSSCYLGCRKPDPAIYRFALDVASVSPAECIYLDDRALLIEAARKLGLPSVQHQSFDQTKSLLEKISLKSEIK